MRKRETPEYAARQARKLTAIEMIENGHTYAEAAAVALTSVASVQKWCRNQGVSPRADAKARSRRGHTATPHDRILDLYMRRAREFGGDIDTNQVVALIASELALTKQEVLEAIR
jgi:transposase